MASAGGSYKMIEHIELHITAALLRLALALTGALRLLAFALRRLMDCSGRAGAWARGTLPMPWRWFSDQICYRAYLLFGRLFLAVAGLVNWIVVRCGVDQNAN